MKVIFHPEAESEFELAKVGYKELDTELGSRFLLEIDRVLGQVTLFPRSGPRHSGFQRCLLHGFPYAVFYRVKPDALQIIALAHTSRRPGYWRKRVSR